MECFVSLKFHVWKYPVDSEGHPEPHSHPLSTQEQLSHLVTVLEGTDQPNSYMSITEKYLPWHFLEYLIIMNYLKN